LLGIGWEFMGWLMLAGAGLAGWQGVRAGKGWQNWGRCLIKTLPALAKPASPNP